MADELEVTSLTIYRDVASLQAMRVPIDGEAGVGYMMRKGYDLPPLMFSPDEVEAIAVGMAMPGRTGDKNGNRSSRTILPLAVFYYIEVAVLAAWCELRRFGSMPGHLVAARAKLLRLLRSQGLITGEPRAKLQ